MTTERQKKTGPKSAIRTSSILLAIAILLLMQGAALAWWERTSFWIWRGGW